jgi:hypothetical protein
VTDDDRDLDAQIDALLIHDVELDGKQYPVTPLTDEERARLRPIVDAIVAGTATESQKLDLAAVVVGRIVSAVPELDVEVGDDGPRWVIE